MWHAPCLCCGIRVRGPAMPPCHCPPRSLRAHWQAKAATSDARADAMFDDSPTTLGSATAGSTYTAGGWKAGGKRGLGNG